MLKLRQHLYQFLFDCENYLNNIFFIKPLVQLTITYGYLHFEPWKIP